MSPRWRSVCRVLALVGVSAALSVSLTGAASASPAIPGVPDCKDAPTAQMPGGGITGFLDEGPSNPPQPLDPFVANPQTSVYEQYGYAGLGWRTYDLGCGGGMRDVEASIDTATGNFMLSAASWGTAATNGLHNKVNHPEQYMTPLDDVVAAVTQRLHDSIWSPWGATALVGVGALLLFYSMAGRLSSVTSAAAWALLVLAVVAGLAQYPTRVATFFDGAVTSSVNAINTGVSGLTDLPASSDPARAQGAVVVDQVLYENWLRGTLGSTDNHAAKTWGPQLYKASAFTWDEAQTAEQDPEQGKRIAERKAENWKKTAAEIQKEDPVAYSYLQGKSGGRAGTGLMALLGSTFTLLFRLVADVFLFAGLVMLRLLVMLFPAVAVIGVMAPMASIVRRVFSMGGASVVNVVAFAAGSAVHTTVISAILSKAGTVGLGVLSLVFCFVVTCAAFIVLYPLLSFSNILGHSGDGQRLIKRGGREAWNYTSRRLATKNALEDAQPPSPAQSTSPEGATASSQTYRHMNLPAESFARPAPYFPVIRAEERTVDGPKHLQLSAVEAPRLDHANRMPESTARPGADGSYDREDPAYTLASTSGLASSDLPQRMSINATDGALSGVLVDEVPESARELPNLAHDSHTQVRRDGVGPRLYDPDTKQTVLSVQRRVEE